MQSTVSNKISSTDASNKDMQPKAEAYAFTDAAQDHGVVIAGKITEYYGEDEDDDQENLEEPHWRPRGKPDIKISSGVKNGDGTKGSGGSK